MGDTALKPTEKPTEVPTETLYCRLMILSDCSPTQVGAAWHRYSSNVLLEDVLQSHLIADV